MFTSLHTLIASGNPLTTITLNDSKIFPELLKLSLNSTLLCDWSSFESLAHLANLRELNVMRIPLCEEIDEKIRRYGIVARMPALCKLNKSEVTFGEREDAERWLLREFEQCPTHPAIYDDYLKKHGVLDQLVNVDMTPATQVTLEFHFEDGRSSELHEIPLKQTVQQLKKWVGRDLLSMPSSSFKLVYFDPDDSTGAEEMRYEQKYLHSYKHMKDGDQIYIQIKQRKQQS